MVQANRRNYYRLLHVQPDAPFEIIRASYRTLMRILKHHPDLGGDDWNAGLINEAYAVLSNAEKREQYDRERQGFERHPGQPDGVPSTLALAVHAESPQLAERLSCAFCQTTNYRGRQHVDALCGGCGAPLRLVGLTARQATERGTQRIEHPGDIRYWVEAAGPDSISGWTVDLSPTGLRFLSQKHLTPGSVIKIESPTLAAVARVTRSTSGNRFGSFATGVRFLTLRLGRPRGTFVSTLA
jgi:hypothetical protein